MKRPKIEKPKRGRPATGFDPVLTVRLPDDLVKGLEAWAKKNGLTRSDAIRQFIELGIKGGERK